MDKLLRNLMHALRALERRPGFSITVVLTLALAVGVSSAVFSAIDTMLLRPLPFPHSERVLQLSEINDRTVTNVSPPRLDDWSHLSKAFEAISGAYVQDVSDTTGQLPEKIREALVAPHFPEVFALRPIIGRGFTDQDFVSGDVALISETYWRSRLSSDPNVLSISIRLRGRALAVVGVMPRQFSFPDRAVSVWEPVAANPKLIPRKSLWYTAVGRLKPGISLQQGEADLTQVQAALAQAYPDSDRDIHVRAVTLKESIVGAAGRSLWLIFGAVSVLLIIACVNIAGLLLAQMAEREQEVALQLALGASRWAVATRILTEVALLVVAGSVLGVLVASASIAAIRALGADLPRVADLAIDGRILVVICLTAVLVTVLCGLLPALKSGNVARSLQQAGRGQVGGKVRLPWVLVCIQVALAVALLDGAGLLLRSFGELVRVQPGFTSSGVLSFRITGGYEELNDAARMVRRIQSTAATIAAIPGIESVATASDVPGIGGGTQLEFNLQGHMAKIAAMTKVVSPGYFATMRIPVLSGALCDERVADGSDTQELMVNRSFVQRFLSGVSPAGLHLVSADGVSISGRILGVVGDAREASIAREPEPTIYACAIGPNPTPYFLVRTRGIPTSMGNTIRLQLRQNDPLRAVFDIQPLSQMISATFAENWLRTVLMSFFSINAVALACLGIYGTLSYSVALRRREIGLFLALGAAEERIVVKFLMTAFGVCIAGCLIGLGLSTVLAHTLQAMLYGVGPGDPVAIMGVTALVLVICAFAAFLPAMRAATVNPIVALRSD